MIALPVGPFPFVDPCACSCTPVRPEPLLNISRPHMIVSGHRKASPIWSVFGGHEAMPPRRLASKRNPFTPSGQVIAPTIVRSTAQEKKNPITAGFQVAVVMRGRGTNSKLQKPMRHGVNVTTFSRYHTRPVFFTSKHTLAYLGIYVNTFLKNSCIVVWLYVVIPLQSIHH